MARSLFSAKINVSDIDRLYQQLKHYTERHFQYEDKFMVDAGIDPRHLSLHRQAYHDFLANASSIHADVAAGNLKRASSLLSFLNYWLAYRILGMDQDMAKQIRAIQAGMAAAAAFEELAHLRASETEPLLQALDGLFHEVTDQNKQHKQLNSRLEQHVALRTAQLSEANRALEELSQAASLTGLPNRRHAMRLLADLWNEEGQRGCQPEPQNLVVMMIDADNFKAVNDQNGHDAGDRVLVAVGQNPLPCHAQRRHGLPAGALEALQALRVPVGDGTWEGSVSIGVAALTPEMATPQELVKRADQALYTAKRSGRNRVVHKPFLA